MLMTEASLEAKLQKRLKRRGKWLAMNPFARSACVTVCGKQKRRGIKRIKMWKKGGATDYYYTDRYEIVFRYQPSSGPETMEVVPLNKLEDVEIRSILEHL